MTQICFLIFFLVGLKEAWMPNFSFLGCLEVVVLWLETNKTTKTTNSVELEASLAPAEAEVGAEAKADQHKKLCQCSFLITNIRSLTAAKVFPFEIVHFNWGPRSSFPHTTGHLFPIDLSQNCHSIRLQCQQFVTLFMN